jgi:hypothetical protein
MIGKLNEKYHIFFVKNTIFYAALLCTAFVLQFIYCANEIGKETGVI